MPDDNLVAIEKTRYHVQKTMEHVAQSLREAASLVDGFSQQLGTIPLSELASIKGFTLSTPAFPALLTPDNKRAVTVIDAVAADGTGKKRKRRKDAKEKKPKDPNAPKRPPSAYLLYQNDVRKAMQEKYKELSYREVLAEISKSWQQMSDTDKKMYIDATNVAKSKYNELKEAYGQSGAKPEEGGLPSTLDGNKTKAVTANDSPAKVETSSAQSEDSSEAEVDEAEESDSEESAASEPEPPKKKVAQMSPNSGRKQAVATPKDDKKKKNRA